MLTAYIVWIAVCLILVCIGLTSFRAKEAVGFFTFEKNAEGIKDVQGYNHAVGKLWITAAVILALIGVPLLYARQNSPIVILPVLGTVFWLLVLLIRYLRIRDRYSR